MWSTLRHIIWMPCMLLGMALHAQPGLLRVLVVDSLEGHGVRDVTVGDADGRPLAITDGQGACVVRTVDARGELHMRHVAYGARIVRFDPAQGEVVVRWAKALLVLPEAEVRSPVPEVVYRHPTLDVAEFEIAPEGIWVLAYGKPRLFREQAQAGRPILADVVLYLLDTAFAEKAWVPIAGDVYGLRRAFGGHVFIEARDRAYHCSYDGHAIALRALSSKELKEDVLPWTDSIPGWLIGNNATSDYPAFDHLAYDVQRRTLRAFCSVQDDHTMELFRSEYKYMSGHDKVVAMDLALRTGVDKQVIAGFMTGFARDPYFHAPYAPLFVVGDTLCVFDHSCGAIRKFDRSFQPAAETVIVYQRRNLWKGTLVQDASTGAVHVIERHGPVTEVRTVDAHTGSTGPVHALEHRFPEQVAVHGGQAYYTYRPFGSERTRWLYREALR